MSDWKTNWVDGETVHSSDINRIEGNGKANEEEIAKIKLQLDGSADANHTHTLDAISETANKKIMTAAERAKLKVIEEGANNYVHPTHTPKESGLYKVTVDSSGHITAVTAVTKSDITALGIPGENTDTKYSVATTESSGLFSSVDKKKLDSVEEGANKYTHPNHLSRSSGLYSIQVDSYGHVVAATKVSKSTITNLGIPGQDTTYSEATTSASGLMSASDKGKLNRMASVSCEVASDFGTALGYGTKAGYIAFAEGGDTKATGTRSHAEGNNTTASGENAHAEGHNTTASGSTSHAEGASTTASGIASHSGGAGSTAGGNYSFTHGYNIKTQCQGEAAFGVFNKNVSSYDMFTIGIGESDTSRNNVFRATTEGKCYGSQAFSASGADFAEYFEWVDGNPENADRRGLFVALEGDKIKLASTDDDYIGVITSTGAFIGNSSSEIWYGMYLRDVFGDFLTEEVEIPETVDETTGEVIPAHVEMRKVLNPEFNPEKEYLGREFRPEWAPVGMLGQIVVVDDGTCQVGGRCAPSTNGVGTASETGYRVMRRIDDNHIKVLVK